MIVENTDSNSVRGLQNMLRNISYYIEDVESVIPDGLYSEDTKNSVISFQKIYVNTKNVHLYILSAHIFLSLPVRWYAAFFDVRTTYSLLFVIPPSGVRVNCPIKAKFL